MLNLRKTLGALLLPAAAFAATASGLTAESAADTDIPMQCQISVSKDRYGHKFEAVMKALETVEGLYELKLNGNGSVINQSGDFYVEEGDTYVLGEATLGVASPEDVKAELTLHVGDTSYECGLLSEI